jgi:hypothetical protein
VARGGGVQVGEDVGAQLRLGLELRVGGDAGLRAAGGVVGPFFGQVGAGVEEGVAAVAGVGAAEGVDRVGGLAGAAGVLAFDPGGAVAFFLLPGLVEHRGRVRAAQAAR